MKKTLEEYRKEIDTVDEELLTVLAKRFDIVREIGKLKKEKDLLPLDEKRWKEVLEKINAKAKKLNLPKAFTKNMYDEIHKAALMIERNDE
jgi:chorismate mutase